MESQDKIDGCVIIDEIGNMGYIACDLEGFLWLYDYPKMGSSAPLSKREAKSLLSRSKKTFMQWIREIEKQIDNIS